MSPLSQADLEHGGELVDLATAPAAAGLHPLVAGALAVADRLVADKVAETNHRNRGPVVDQILVGVDGKGADMLCLARYSGSPCAHCDGKPAPTADCFGAPWCARTAVYCYALAVQSLGLQSPFAGAGGLASATKWGEWAQKTGRLVKVPQPGDVGLIQPDPHHGHVVIAAAIDGADVLTREGNHNDMAAAVRRPIASITRWVRVVL